MTTQITFSRKIFEILSNMNDLACEEDTDI